MYGTLLEIVQLARKPTSCDRIYLISPLKFFSTEILVPLAFRVARCAARIRPCNRIQNTDSNVIEETKTLIPLTISMVIHDPLIKIVINFQTILLITSTWIHASTNLTWVSTG